MVRYKIALLFLGFLTPAVADQPTQAHIDRIEKCVAANSAGQPQSSALSSCVGQVATDCSSNSSETTVSLASCLEREHGAWDALLNAWWKPLRARAKGNGTWDALLASQRQWIKDRDAECQRAYDAAGGGSIRVIYGWECQRDLTAQKAVEFFYQLYR